ncbi:uncharacterized protein KQ657_004530 [Scheffersomyces spartinae]|uniref:Phosphatidate phosphatase APP1 catalytic domain-containing protein n=1 Tax=Scheffersomyces spartinae TaxID=45513 RepID=A0A9P7VAE2_9ASCO|nr:uncharacterized protein KQ657_004530 [Scheffersomyces spartinae]KAG7194318.1 hypothetical protein KQ657_004530 [Scheffersomyces spartinae]
MLPSTSPKLSKYFVLRNFLSDYKALRRAFPYTKSDLLLVRAQKSRRNKQSSSMDQDNQDTPSANGNGSKRQRLLGIARATRDTYIPRLTGSVSQLATDVTMRMSGGGSYYNRDLFDELGRLKFPKDTSITLYDTYTRIEDGKYFVNVKGWLWCPGVMTRKNRLILSLAKQITKYNVNPTKSTQAVEKWESESLQQDILSDDVESVNSDGTISPRPPLSSNSSTTSSITTFNDEGGGGNDNRIKERMSQFIARSIPNSELEISVGSEDLQQEITTTKVITNNNGHFDCCIAVDYLPSIVQVRSSHDESIYCFKEIMLVEDNGVGLISDIDDTIKLTGVIGDKRSLMTSLLTKDVSDWLIPSMCKWYNDMFLLSNVSFHYVSNSPWQLYGVIKDFMAQGNFPKGSINLKQYSGNIISSLMEPSKSRKSSTLNKILEDFKYKRFICIGDSGEYDFEAYVDLAIKYPGRILAIYIRYVENSMSDVDDTKILKQVIRMIDKHKLRQQKRGITKSKTFSVYHDDNNQPNLIDLSDDISSNRHRKLPPMKPIKPQNLKGEKNQNPPPLPKRRDQSSNGLRKTHTETDIYFHPTEHENDLSENLYDVYNSHDFYELQDMDNKGYQWVTKMNDALVALKNSPIEIHIFKDDEELFFESSLMNSKEALTDLTKIVKENN